jgi:hypothetical protein
MLKESQGIWIRQWKIQATERAEGEREAEEGSGREERKEEGESGKEKRVG